MVGTGPIRRLLLSLRWAHTGFSRTGLLWCFRESQKSMFSPEVQFLNVGNFETFLKALYLRVSMSVLSF